MLSSIHPLGERTRNNSWAVTVGAFGIGSIAAGTVLGMLSAVIGVASGFSSTPAIVPVVILGLSAGAEVLRVPIPTHKRQVNERWIGTFRGWVYGLGFGAQLGAGLATYVVTWAVPALVATMAWLGEIPLGAAIGATFGLGRTLPLLAAGWIDRPDRLSRFSSCAARVAHAAHTGAAIVLVVVAVGAGAQL